MTLSANADAEPIRIPKVAEIVAQTLRRKIVTREYETGHLLPSEGALMVTYDVARTTIRDAFRILESEGLLEVRRGAGGGGIVRAPGVSSVSSYAALLLQSERATFQDVHEARSMIEAPAARMLACRGDDPHVVEALRRALMQEAQSADDESALAQAEGWFHRQVVDLTGNRVLSMLSAVANRLIAQQVAVLQGDEGSRRKAHTGIAEAHKAHARLVDLIASGSEAEAEDLWRRHLEASRENLAKSSKTSRSVLDLLP